MEIYLFNLESFFELIEFIKLILVVNVLLYEIPVRFLHGFFLFLYAVNHLPLVDEFLQIFHLYNNGMSYHVEFASHILRLLG